MNRIIILLICLLQVKKAPAQIGGVVYLGVDLITAAHQKAKQKKKQKLAETYTTYDKQGGSKVPIMRVPDDKINSNAADQIMVVQAELEAARNHFQQDQHLRIQELSYKITMIRQIDPDWVTAHYSAEARFYENYERALLESEREQKRQQETVQRLAEDSIRHGRRMQELELQNQLARTRDSIAELETRRKRAEYRTRDSIATLESEKRRMAYQRTLQESRHVLYNESVQGHHFVNAEDLSLREKATSKSKTIVSIGSCSYVRIIEAKEVNGYATARLRGVCR